MINAPYGHPAQDISTILASCSVERRTRQHERRSGEFLKGPIPLWWLTRASQEGRAALTVGILLWFRSGCSKSTNGLTVSERLYLECGLSRYTFGRGVRKLESVGLVTVDRQVGRKLRITLTTVVPSVDPIPTETKVGEKSGID
jgi:hypothetical protein